ncbi:JAB domain-containing protein [Candidatus Kuenenia stuttgartensis]|uniref:Similar to DNA repair protein RadC n=1 Tax=Kuenenia stuttgartiensis TaxID=174633 RepID=Q1Q559_KUEST|nr:JAB domain-containing protein [Candidatus Kuenenia stuttgartiensis]CAJ75146.1 similar to DNA repair protein RadC [Candidatus Kuenenia stuttgartiensis]
MILSEKKKSVHGPGDVATIMRSILAVEGEIDRSKEHFWTVGLNNKNVIQYIELVSLGTLTSAVLGPREVFRLAVHKAIANILLVHNHPAGDPEPSKEDVSVTQRLISAGQILGIQVLDHVIIGNPEYYSFKERGIIQ